MQDTEEFFMRLGSMLKEDRTVGSIGEESLMSISQAELLDSEYIFDKYMRSIANTTVVEQGQLLVSAVNPGVYRQPRLQGGQHAALLTALG